MKNKTELINLPLVALRGIVMFPEQLLHFDVGREKSIAAVKAASEQDRLVFLITQKTLSEVVPNEKELYRIGVIAKVEQTLKVSERRKILHISVRGISRARLYDMNDNGKYLVGNVESLPERKVKKSEKIYADALIRETQLEMNTYINLSPPMPEDISEDIYTIKDPGELADFIAGNIVMEFEDRQKILEKLDPIDRLMDLNVFVTREQEILTLESGIQDKVQDRIDRNQRDYYLQEQLKVIHEELDDHVQPENDFSEYRSKIQALKADDDVKEKLFRECSRLENMTLSSPDALVSRTYIETCLELPWGVYTKENNNLEKSRKILEHDHYGLEKVKKRIMEYLAVSSIAPDIKGQIICLSGPPGVGKTSVARSIARATGRKYVRIALGGVTDEAEIRGHRRTYVGSMPGRIIDALRKVKTANPVILLDEIDKLSSDYKGDPTSALLEVLDPEQNCEFVDHYIDLPFDLSRVLFITTANVRTDIPDPLQDRMEIIELDSYTYEEKFNIAKKHLISKQLKRHGITASQLRITDSALKLIIEGYTREAGVRLLEQRIATICRNAAAKIVEGTDLKITVKPENVEEYLGSRKYKEEDFKHPDEIGIANGLAWTSVGGEMLEIESAVLDGSGKLELTGSLGDVMRESAKTAVSYIRSKADELAINKDFYKNSDIHIHVPDGATPKDGPSAGVTIATSLVSALTGKKVRNDVAMTGEITLRGRVLPIGGLKEKSMAAYRAGIKTVLIPYDNVSDLDEVDKKVKDAIVFKPVKSVEQVWYEAVLDFVKR